MSKILSGSDSVALLLPLEKGDSWFIFIKITLFRVLQPIFLQM